MANNRWPKPKAVVAAIVGACVVATLLEQPGDPFLSITVSVERPPSTPSSRRELRARKRRLVGDEQKLPGGEKLPPLYPWARRNVRPLSTMPEPSKETVVFWHIPKSGGSTAKAYYRCFGLDTDVESRPEEILRAKETGTVASGKFDLIFSSYPDLAVQELFDSSRQTRVLALFRHPVDRLISKFFYLQIATWERTYKPEWKDMDLLEWVTKHNMDNNHMVKKLAGKVQRMPATEKDLRLAMGTIERRFVVGLMSDMKESIRRFDAVLGASDETYKYHKKCNEQYFGGGEKKKNSNAHQKVEKDSPAWKLLAKQNAMDIRLYEYILHLYEEQREVVDAYAASVAVSPA